MYCCKVKRSNSPKAVGRLKAKVGKGTKGAGTQRGLGNMLVLLPPAFMGYGERGSSGASKSLKEAEDIKVSVNIL